METFPVINNEQRQQFQTTIEGETAFMEYRMHNGAIVFMHTEVPDKLSGKGIGSSLAAYAFNYAQQKGLPVKVYCPFVLTWLKRHPERAGQLTNS
jgi:uncharacterized protein